MDALLHLMDLDMAESDEDFRRHADDFESHFEGPPRRRAGGPPGGAGGPGRRAKRAAAARRGTPSAWSPGYQGPAVLGKGDDQFWRPAADIFVTPDALVIHLDLPGVPKDEIHVELKNDDTIVVHGNHQGPKGYESATARVRERNVGKFEKVVRLSRDSDIEKIQSRYENGLLEVKVPKKEESKARKIEIKVDGGDNA
ncbi:hypothetical protein HDV00_010069 [Rhizophlyctis rosea]|nr:hypothetical protein HDV00_010069 [Rhizophlyctis rosea]